jgi:hypothetical protein
MMHDSSDFRPDPAVRELLLREFEGPGPELFLDRLRRELALLPDRVDEWDVLAHWARPGVLVAAMAAGMLLGATLWRNWREQTPAPTPAVSVALLEEPRLTTSPIVYTVMGER